MNMTRTQEGYSLLIFVSIFIFFIYFYYKKWKQSDDETLMRVSKGWWLFKLPAINSLYIFLNEAHLIDWVKDTSNYNRFPGFLSTSVNNFFLFYFLSLFIATLSLVLSFRFKEERTKALVSSFRKRVLLIFLVLSCICGAVFLLSMYYCIGCHY